MKNWEHLTNCEVLIEILKALEAERYRSSTGHVPQRAEIQAGQSPYECPPQTSAGTIAAF